ncbi:MAG: DUF1127 domain-containing protein [Pseudoruegeria sp.]
MAVASNITTVNTGAFDRIAAYFRGLSVRLEQHKVYRATLSELDVLTDRELKDLALSRSDIKRVAYEAAYRG